jgi:L-alanine-DL-glutamate epimerase-like enolase superfamily enzyme
MNWKITKADVWMIALQLKEPFRFAYGTFHELPRVLIRVEAHSQKAQVCGWGEAAIDFPFVDYDQFDVYDALVKTGRHIIGRHLTERHEILSHNHSPFLKVAPAARCALNMALDDALGKAAGIGVGDIYGIKREAGVSLCSIGFDQAGRPEVWSGVSGIVKIKVGQDVSSDIKSIKLAEELANDTHRKYALDFNAAYTVKDVFQLIRELQDGHCWGLRSCVLWEQPLTTQSSIEDWATLVKFFSSETHPPVLVADESFSSVTIGSQLVEVSVGLNYKIQKFGGILTALELEKNIGLTKHKMKSFIGGTFPSPLGRAYDTVAGRVMLSANLPGDGLLPASTYLSPETIRAFSPTPKAIGLGVQPIEGELPRLIIEDPLEEFHRIRKGLTPKRIGMDIGDHYAEKYFNLSGRTILWNLSE